jgi:hypothetical protein
MATLIASMFPPAPAPGDDPAFRRAVKRGFVALDAGVHRGYLDWCRSARRPYVSIETRKGNRVRLYMNTCDWNLSHDQHRYLLRLASSPTGNCGGYNSRDPRHGDFVLYDVPDDRAATIAWRVWEAANDSRPDGRDRDEECSGV